ncbi:MAG: 23S rRNA (uracil(1939)-C(5))-methyltransferase RlmD, partial [Chitinophagaceae bacterium]|nr:23S rRNA (uracil(1939)-C(5))-methyltransferase RlmD [Chitinophagaceae bacterium]
HQFPQITSLNYTINTKWNDTIYDLEVHLFAGEKYIEERLENFKFNISPKSFFQTNPTQAVELYNVVKRFADCKGNETLYDLYCGTGSIGIFLSNEVKKIVGVESVSDAIEDAKINAKCNQLENASYYAGDVIKICNHDFFQKHGHPDIVVIDPPRAGCHLQLLEKLLEIRSEKIVYVSCNPATQARDLQILQKSYTAIQSQAVDMFPHTHHIENVVLLHLNQ